MTTPTPATLDEFKEHLNKDSAVTGEDSEVLDTLVAATEAVEGWAPRGRSAVGPIVVREFTERVRADDGRLFLGQAPVDSITSVTHLRSGTAYVEADLDVDELTGTVMGLDRWLPAGKYEAVYKAGRAEVPVSLKKAVLIIGAHIWKTQRGPKRGGGLGGVRDGDQSEHRVGAGYLIPNQAATLMTPHTSVFVG